MLLVLVFLAVMQVMHMIRCEDTNQASRKHPEPSRLNAILDDEEVACDDGCCSKKKTWSIALSMMSLHIAEPIQGNTIAVKSDMILGPSTMVKRVRMTTQVLMDGFGREGNDKFKVTDGTGAHIR
ncbi:hypothetical protein Tco_0255173 [Tanacetum coccineum]